MFRKFLAAAVLLVPTVAAAAPPAVFLKDAIRGNYSETVLGRMIQNRGASSHVREFGRMLVSDHSRALAEAQAIARRMHMRIPATLTPEARRERTVLNRLSGRSFDREVRRYMIEDHREDIAKFQAQARSGDRATAGYAAATVPAMRRHLAMAQSIRG
jgi:putative membrane protein